MNPMASQSSLQDCYFYFYSSCTKGDECPFRHCQLALGSETVCSLWREGRCFRSNCKFRHMESRINRSTIPCYWENQPGGCRKPHCVFMHRKLRNGVQAVKDVPGLILPTSDGKNSPKHPDFAEISILPNKAPLVEKTVDIDVAPDPSLTPVPPLVLSFDEGEESDTESVTSTPVKQGEKRASLTKNSPSMTSDAAEDKDFGIKTLEQIRMEKIHKESDSFYGAAYASTPIDSPRLMEQLYPPKSEFLALPKDSTVDKSLPAPIEPKLSAVNEENDLRGRLLNKRNAPSNKVNQVKRLISFKKQNGNQMEVDSKKLDFKIKTLEEIRKEKENKQNKSDVLDNSPVAVPPSEEKGPLNNTKQRTFRKLKINRKPRELYSASTNQKPDAVAPNRTETTATPLVSNGIDKSLPKSSELSSEVPVLSKTSSDTSPGKRKSDDDLCPTASKAIKIVSSSSDGPEKVSRVRTASARTAEKEQEQPCPQRPQIQSSPAANKASDMPSHVNASASKVIANQSSVPDNAINGIIASPPSSLSSSLPSFKPEEKSKHTSDENVCTSKTESSEEVNRPAVKKDHLNDRSMSVDAELDELLGDEDMNIDDMDATQNDDILLQIEEFLES